MSNMSVSPEELPVWVDCHECGGIHQGWPDGTLMGPCPVPEKDREIFRRRRAFGDPRDQPLLVVGSAFRQG